MTGSLYAAVRVDGRVDVRFEVAAGEVLAVLGPNGAGKSTMAAAVAGLVRPDEALITVDGRVLTDSAGGVAVPAWDRRVGLLQQDPLLFPHLSVLDNVAFAACAGGRGGGIARTEARRWLAEVDAADLAGRRPTELSGGEAQRVALARALAARPQVLMLDEPLAGLDVAAAASVRTALRRVLAERPRPVVLITHDLPDVIALAGRVLVLENGRVSEVGPTAEVLAAPRSRFAASVAGVNVVAGVVEETGDQSTVLRTAAGLSWHGMPAAPLAVGGPAIGVFSPAAVGVFRERPHGSPRNVACGDVAALEATGTAIRVRLAEQSDGAPGLAADVTVAAVDDLALGVGKQVWFAVKTQAVALYPGSRERSGQP